MSKEYTFRLTLGDKGGDGHNMREDFFIRSSHPRSDIRMAYTKACKELSECEPDMICSECEDNEVSDEKAKILKGHGFVFEDTSWVDYEEMARFTLWLIRKGNPEIKIEVLELNQLLNSDIGYGMEQL